MQMRSGRLMRSSLLAFLALNLLLGVAKAQVESVLHNFCANNCTAANAGDGADPIAGLVFDTAGNLYGTTYNGGEYGLGTVFKVTPSGKEKVLYTFRGAPDGASPYDRLLPDRRGNLYGTTSSGGAYNGGTIFKITPSGKESVLYSFCAQSNCTDGAAPVAGLVFDTEGNLYGTTLRGGAYAGCGIEYGYGCGTVFKVTPSGKESVLYNFCAQSGCSDGESPYSTLIFDAKENLYGTTLAGGDYGGPTSGGTVFKVTLSGKESVLHSFCEQSQCADGADPYAGLVFDRKGNLYGTTQWGGVGGGTVFKITRSGKESVLYNFCGQSNCSDGLAPNGGLIFDKKGNFYGTTYWGGAYAAGVVFKLVP